MAPRPLTNKQEAFAVAFVQSGIGAEAYRLAYDAAGMSPASVGKESTRLLAHPGVAARIAALRAPAIKAAGMSVERTLKEVQRLSEVDPRRFFRDDGTMVPMFEWDADMAAAVASVEVIPVLLRGKRGATPKFGHTYKIKFWDKNAALDKAMKHLGLFEKDNAQSRESLVLHVEAAKPIKK